MNLESRRGVIRLYPYAMFKKQCVVLVTMVALVACAPNSIGVEDAGLGVGIDEIRAVTAANELYRKNPTNPMRLAEYARALRGIGSLEKAVEEIRRAKQLLLADPAVGVELLRSELLLNRPSDAETNARQLLNTFPEHPEIKTLLATSLARQNNHLAAQEIFAELEQLYPYDRLLLTNYAVSLALTRDLEEAVVLMERAMESSDANAGTRQNYALVLGLSGDIESAREVLLKDLPAAAVERNLLYIQTLIGRYDPLANNARKQRLEAANEEVEVRTAPQAEVSAVELPLAGEYLVAPTTASIGPARDGPRNIPIPRVASSGAGGDGIGLRRLLNPEPAASAASAAPEDAGGGASAPDWLSLFRDENGN